MRPLALVPLACCTLLVSLAVPAYATYIRIQCPADITVTLAKGQGTIALGDLWKEPTSNGKVTLVSPVRANRSYRFPYGNTIIRWKAENSDGKSETCVRHVNVKDKEAPVSTYCPGPKIFYPTSNNAGVVPFKKPTFKDNVAIDKVVAFPEYADGGFKFSSPLTYNFYYTARDRAWNKAHCNFQVVIGGTRCRVPPEYPNLRGSWMCTYAGSKICMRRCPQGTAYTGTALGARCRESDGAWLLFGGASASFGDCVERKVVKLPAPCPAGYVRGPAYNTCYACGRGTYFTAGKCEKCSAGTYQSKDAQTTCNKCPSGTSSLEGSFECRKLCPAGTLSKDGMRPFCNLCPPGKYQPTAGSKACLPCAHATNTNYGATKCQGATTAPVIERVVTPGNLTETKDNTLECYIRDTPELVSVTWKIKGAVPPDFVGKPKITELTNKAGKVIGARLVIQKATRHNGDLEYVCVATNTHAITQKVVPLSWFDKYNRG